MNKPVILDWKFAAALSVPVAVGVLLWKLTPDQAVAVSLKAIDAIRDYAVAINSTC